MYEKSEDAEIPFEKIKQHHKHIHTMLTMQK
jgi:hypothetical protein